MWQDGVIVTDYTHAFYPEMAPAHLAFALLARGYAPPVTAGVDFAYAELGCGQGLTSNMLAALYPQGRFQAMDLLRSHMDGATALAAAAGHDNVVFHQESFGDFARREGEPFDVIALHGVWSWVDGDNRRILSEIVERRLKPGGVLFLSYNCLPGWAPDMPVRALLMQLVEQARGPLPDRIDQGLRALRRLADQGGYFHKVPSAEALVENLQSKSESYVAHEYLNRHWAPFYHVDVAGPLRDIGLEFAASATLLDHLDHWQVGPEHLPLANDDETLRDVLTCRRFRRDLFVRNPRRLSEPERLAGLADLRFALTVTMGEVPENVTAPGGEQELDPALYGPLKTRLAQGPCRLGELPGDFDAKVEALLVLCGLGMAVPSFAAADAGRCRALNRAILAANRSSPAVRQMAAANWGSGLVVDLLDRLFLLAEGEGDDPPDFAWKILSGRGKRLRRGGQWLDGHDNLIELRRLYDIYQKERRAFLMGAGVA